MGEEPLYIRAARKKANLIVFHGMIKGKGLQFPGTNFVDKTLKPPESTYKTTFLRCMECSSGEASKPNKAALQSKT